MNNSEIRRAKTALLDKSVLGYRRTTSASRPERTIDAKVGIDKSREPAGGRLVRATDAKVGLPKIAKI